MTGKIFVSYRRDARFASCQAGHFTLIQLVAPPER
jgi:hypothetical protein